MLSGTAAQCSRFAACFELLTVQNELQAGAIFKSVKTADVQTCAVRGANRLCVRIDDSLPQITEKRTGAVYAVIYDR